MRRTSRQQIRPLLKLFIEAPATAAGICLWITFFSLFTIWLLQEKTSHSPRTIFSMIAFAFASLVFFIVPGAIIDNRRNRRQREMVRSAIESGTAMDAVEFLELTQASCPSNPDEFTGIYILHNMTVDKYYVGQSARVLHRVRQHFTGHGNGDVYADFKYGDTFSVQTVPLVQSGYQSLNDLERDAIDAFDAYTKGYNYTRGNKR